jgi:hypothetical protein
MPPVLILYHWRYNAKMPKHMVMISDGNNVKYIAFYTQYKYHYLKNKKNEGIHPTEPTKADVCYLLGITSITVFA